MFKNKKGKKVKVVTIIWSVLILAVIYLVSVGIIIYFFPSVQSRIIQRTARVIPYPVAIVGDNIITFRKLEKELSAVQKFYENQNFSKLGMRVDFSTADGKKRLQIKEKEILDKLIENAIIKEEANQRGIKLTKDIINEEVDRKLKEFGTKNYLRHNLEKLYGWKIEDFKQDIVAPDLYKSQLFAKIRKNNSSYLKAKEKIEQAKKDLNQGTSFREVVAKYSEGESAKNNGELGWFTSNQMLPAVSIVVYNLKIGQTSEIIQSPIGYHIVQLEDQKIENGKKIVKVRQVFVKTETFSQWLVKKEQTKSVFILMRKFQWSKDNAQVEFRSSAMRAFEQKIIKNPTNDPSMMF